MLNEIIKQENRLNGEHKQERSIEVVTTEIKTLCNQARALALTYAIEIGRRLDEAKSMLSHGEWSEWLKNEVDFSQSTANNYMKLFEEYSDTQVSIFGAELKSQSLGNLSYTKALKLLSVPAEEREEFAEKNNVEAISVRELDRLIKERDDAIKRAEELEVLQSEKNELQDTLSSALNEVDIYKKKFDTAENEMAELKERFEKAKSNEKKLKDKLSDLKNNPQIPQDKMDKITAEAEAKAAEAARIEIQEKISDTANRLDEAIKDKEAAESNALILQNKINELEKQLQMSNPKVAEFKAIFEVVQRDLLKLDNALNAIEDNEMREKLSRAIEAVMVKYLKN